MANEKHLLVTASGGYTGTPTQFVQETWQIGIRCALVFDGAVDPIGTLPNNWNPAPLPINRTETNWTITGNWFVDGPGLGTFQPDDWLNDQLGTLFDDWLGATSCFSSRVQLRELRVYPIGTDGKAIPAPPYAVGSPITLTYTGTLPVGGNSGAFIPPQCSVVASYRTSQVGRRGRGRSFLPPVNVTSLDEGHLGGTALAAILANQVTLLEGMAYDSAIPGDSQLRPIVTGSPWVNYSVISSVVVDSIIDTQRRRRRSAVGTASTASVSY